MEKLRRLLMVMGVLLGISSTALGQQINGNFDTFEVGWNTVGQQPVGWKGSNVYQTVKAVIFDTSKKQQLVWEEASGYSEKAVMMKNLYVGAAGIGTQAPGYITLGTPWVYAVMDLAQCDGGTRGGQSFSFQPDALHGYIKRVMGTETSDKNGTLNNNEVAKIFAYAWKGSTSSTVSRQETLGKSTVTTAEMIDRDKDVLGIITSGVTKSNFELIMNTEYSINPASDTEWKEVTIPLNYLSESIPEKINVIISSADYFTTDKSKIGDNNILYADEFTFIYYSTLSDLKYDGSTISGFTEETTTYDMSSVVFDESLLSYIKKGKGASVSHNYDSSTGILTITVLGNDYNATTNPNMHQYAIQFKKVTPMSTLSDLKYDGVTIHGFAEETISYDMSSVVFDENLLTYTKSDPTSTVKHIFNKITSVLTINVYGSDYVAGIESPNCHVYKVQFKPAAASEYTSYIGKLAIKMGGQLLNISNEIGESIEITSILDNKVDLQLSNFSFMGANLGDIYLKDVSVDSEGRMITSQVITIDGAGASLGNLPVTLDAIIVNGELRASISILWSMDENTQIPIQVELYPYSTTNIDLSDVTLVDMSGEPIEIATIKAGLTNTNCLVYVQAGTEVASIDATNVIVGDKAASIVITDKVPFHAPKAFTADAISYTRNCYLDGGWETIMLPFAVTSVTDNDVTKDYVLEKCTGMEKGNTITFARETTWAANTPYIISFGEATGAAGETKPYVFSGSGAIGVTEPSYVMNELKGSYIDEDIAAEKTAYMMNAAGTNFVPNEANSVVYPFRAYIDNSGNKFNAPNFSVEHDGGATGMNAADATSERVYAQDGNIIVESATKVVVADLSGRIVRTINAPEEVTVIEGLSKGFYIVNRHKVFVK